MRRILAKTRKSLYEEWATAAGFSIAEAIKEIDSLLRLTVETLIKR